LYDDSDDLTETHEINVTPFFDVMLAPLIIFMVAAPLSTSDLPCRSANGRRVRRY
jgi:biopolymer transport protein ExbD